MQSPPIGPSEIDARIRDHVDELLQLWWAEQGSIKVRDLDLVATAIPFPRDGEIRALDLCCGPGDVGRAIRRTFPNARIDCIDRDPFLMSICKAANRRDGIPGRLVVQDLKDEGWLDELPGPYDVVAVVNALHWFDTVRAEQLLNDVHASLREGGVFLLAEPVSPVSLFATGFAEWKARQPQRYSEENWKRFWSRANTLLGYDHIRLLGSRDAKRIGDELSVAGWIELIKRAGFESVDVLLRDADQLIGATQKL